MIYFGEEHQMVAPFHCLREGAFHTDQGVRQKGHAGFSGDPLDTVEAVDSGPGETAGDLLLLPRKNVDAEAAGGLEMVQDYGAPVQAEQDHGRIERYRRERIDGDAVR